MIQSYENVFGMYTRSSLDIDNDNTTATTTMMVVI